MTAIEPTLLRLDNVQIGYDGRPLLRPLSLSIGRGEFWGVVGPNGGGKTTLLKTMLGLLSPVRGGVERGRPNLHFGYVPQRQALRASFPLTVYDVVLMGCYGQVGLGRGPTRDDRRRAREELERVGLAPLSGRRFSALSGGQQQKALMARALVADPDVLVLDEPTTGMDLPGEADILSFLRALHRETGKAVLMIGHHIASVAGVVDHLCLINKDDDLFETGSIETMLDAERLTLLYGREIGVERVRGEQHIYVCEEDRHG